MCQESQSFSMETSIWGPTKAFDIWNFLELLFSVISLFYCLFLSHKFAVFWKLIRNMIVQQFFQRWIWWKFDLFKTAFLHSWWGLIFPINFQKQRHSLRRKKIVWMGPWRNIALKRHFRSSKRPKNGKLQICAMCEFYLSSLLPLVAGGGAQHSLSPKWNDKKLRSCNKVRGTETLFDGFEFFDPTLQLILRSFMQVRPSIESKCLNPKWRGSCHKTKFCTPAVQQLFGFLKKQRHFEKNWDIQWGHVWPFGFGLRERTMSATLMSTFERNRHINGMCFWNKTFWFQWFKNGRCSCRTDFFARKQNFRTRFNDSSVSQSGRHFWEQMKWQWARVFPDLWNVLDAAEREKNQNNLCIGRADLDLRADNVKKHFHSNNAKKIKIIVWKG